MPANSNEENQNMPTDFYKEVGDFVHSLDFKYEYCVAEQCSFACLQILKGEKKVLLIMLIAYGKWKDPAAYELYEKSKAHVHEIRNKENQAIILWEDQWRNSRSIVKSRLKALLGISVRIPARLTYTSRIDKAITEKFLSKNHLQGNVASKYRYGLFLPVRYFRILPDYFIPEKEDADLLVAVATYSNAKIFHRNGTIHRSCELIRFANHCETTVVGGINKLLKAFISDFQPNDIMTYADLEWSDGTSYERIGFEYISQRPPVSFVVDTEKHIRFPHMADMLSPMQISILNAGSKKFVKKITY
jgi:hypothetical protein